MKVLTLNVCGIRASQKKGLPNIQDDPESVKKLLDG